MHHSPGRYHFIHKNYIHRVKDDKISGNLTNFLTYSCRIVLFQFLRSTIWCLFWCRCTIIDKKFFSFEKMLGKFSSSRSPKLITFRLVLLIMEFWDSPPLHLKWCSDTPVMLLCGKYSLEPKKSVGNFHLKQLKTDLKWKNSCRKTSKRNMFHVPLRFSNLYFNYWNASKYGTCTVHAQWSF